MASSNSKSILLTVVISVALMAGRLQNLKSWMSNLGDLPIKEILVHDEKDQRTEDELVSTTSTLDDSRFTIPTLRSLKIE